ncbi:hypothetical protein AVEN_85709-1 [Araneus ventricosus]|uniref:Uncharacterized protein n=1 Tax=Araneus ventricosus TaxID=182803 RepID=A0A4Y2RZG6_ARAVE|nr:hypothetical protein AVEN_129462-1 [Araneus ventricosus]GBN81300.1 hypothetical protein AVEN_85709-1 [Araneus ventricosus]
MSIIHTLIVVGVYSNSHITSSKAVVVASPFSSHRHICKDEIRIPVSRTPQTHHVLFQCQTTNRALTQRNSPSQGTPGPEYTQKASAV